MKIAIVGSGIAGNVVAHHLYRHHPITLFEAASYIGGHTHTHTVSLAEETHEIDTGFIVFNDWTYPHFNALLKQLKVDTQDSSMSFSVSNRQTGLEYNGTTLNTLFAQRTNLLRPSFLRMIREILRFNRLAPLKLSAPSDQTLGQYLSQNGYSENFTKNYLIPMGAAIWSTDPALMLNFPVDFFIQFFHNHGMLSVENRPQWRTIRGGSARYVEKLTSPFRDRIRLSSPVVQVRRYKDGVGVCQQGLMEERFDAIFLACHADQALTMLSDPTPLEKTVMGAFTYQKNEALLHTDIRSLPRNKRAWAAWNYEVPISPLAQATLTYNMNILQSLRSQYTFCVSLNPTHAIDPQKVIRRITYHHPLFTPQAVAAQSRQKEINGLNRTYYCGAYWRNGFHEDGVQSALNAVEHFKLIEHA
jgi:predicted NAD/FAD-binding protein